MMDDKAIHAHVTGRVQGVSFRAWVRDEALARGLTGWVRNESDGSVTATISGPAAAVAEMEEALYHGPPAARVDAVRIAPAEWPEADGFDIRY